MEITLEKIELVKDRTGVSYKEAKEALEANECSVVDAIIAIEESIDERGSQNLGKQGAAVVERIKNLIKKGNVSKIVVKKDNDVVLNIPVNVGIVGTIIAPIPMIVAVAASFGFKCNIEVVKDDGSVIDVSERASDTFDTVVEKGAVAFDGVKNKSSNVYQSAKTRIAEKNLGETFEEAKDKAKDLTEKAKDKGSDMYESAKTKFEESNLDEKFEFAWDKAKDLTGKAKDKGSDMYESAKAKIEAAREANNDFAINIAEDLEAAAEAVEEERAEKIDSKVDIVDITDKTN